MQACDSCLAIIIGAATALGSFWGFWSEPIVSTEGELEGPEFILSDDTHWQAGAPIMSASAGPYRLPATLGSVHSPEEWSGGGPGPLSSPPEGLSQECVQTVTVWGQVSYRWGNDLLGYEIRPASFVDIYLYLGFFSGLEMTTNSAGLYEFPPADLDTCVANYIYTYAKNGAVVIRKNELGNPGYYQVDVFGAYPDENGRVSVDVCVCAESEEYLRSAIFLATLGYDLHAWFEAETGFAMPLVDVILPDPSSVSYADCGGWLGNDIHVADSSRWGELSFAHEYGHALMCSGYGNRMPPGTERRTHNPNSEFSPGFALSEGWADFVAYAYTLDVIETAEDSGQRHLEDGPDDHASESDLNGDWYIWDGLSVEGSVTALLWDIWDASPAEATNRVDMNADDIMYFPALMQNAPPGTLSDEPLLHVGRDSLHIPLSTIWSILDNDSPDTMQEFWQHWYSTTDNTPVPYGFEREMLTLYFDHGISEVNGDGVVDNKAPGILEFTLLTTPDPTLGRVRGTLLFRVEIDDPDMGDEVFVRWRLEISQDQLNWQPAAEGALDGVFDIAFDSQRVPDGEWWFRVVADDEILASINVPGQGPIRTVVDNTAPLAPAVSSDTHSEGLWSNVNLVHFVWSSAPGDTDVASYDYESDGQLTSAFGANDVYVTYADGGHDFRVRGRDHAENVGAWSTYYSVLIDTVSPAVTLLSENSNPPSPQTPANGAASDWNRPTFAWTAGDLSPSSTLTFLRFEAASSDQTQADSSFPPAGLLASLEWTSTQGGTPPTQCVYETCYALNMPKGMVYWHVLARDAAGNSNGWSANGQVGNTVWSYENTEIHRSTLTDPPLEVTHYSVRLTWTQNTEDHDFIHYRPIWATPDFTSGVEQVGPATANYVRSQTDHTVRYLVCGTQYQFKVRTVDTIWDARDSLNWVTVTTAPGVTPTPVTLNDPFNIGSSGMTLQWTQYSLGDFNRYEIHYTTDPSFGSWSTKEITSQNINIRTVSGLNSGTTYYFRVRVVPTCPGFQADSNVVSGTTTSTPNGVLEGHVYSMPPPNGDSHPVSGALVEVWQGTVRVGVDTTNELGFYHIEGLPTSQPLRITVTDPESCYQWAEEPSLTIPDGGTVVQDFYATWECQ